MSFFSRFSPRFSEKTYRYTHALWLLTKRDLRIRYSTNVLGYLWSFLDPLVMSAIYWFIFTVVFERSVGADPYIVFLLAGLLPWAWFSGSIAENSRAFLRDAKIIRSTNIPRSIWILKTVLAKGIEFLLSLPVLALFAFASGASINILIVLFPLALILQTLLVTAFGLILAPLVLFFRDLERATKLILRFMFYASPIIYSANDLPDPFVAWGALNPLFGIFSIYRSMFFAEQLNWYLIGVSSAVILILLALSMFIFSRSESQVLKEI